MPIHKSYNDKPILWYGDRSIKKYRPAISNALKSKFGIKTSYSQEEVTKSMQYAFEWYCSEFLGLMSKELSIRMYQWVFILHEQSIEIRREYEHVAVSDAISTVDFAMYRRVLKLILEQACDLDLVSGETLDVNCRNRVQPIIEDLLYLGDFAYALSNLISDQELQGDCRDLLWTKEEQYYYDFKHHYGFLNEELMTGHKNHMDRAIVREGTFERFTIAIKEGFGIEYNDVEQVILGLHEHTKDTGGKMVLHNELNFVKNLEVFSESTEELTKVFYSGLLLSRENKMSMQDVIFRPHNLNRYFDRPILKWTLDGEELILLGDQKWEESVGQLCSNVFGWKKIPEEWALVPELKAFAIKEFKDNDKVLEDEVEGVLKKNNIPFDRTVTNLRKENNQNFNIETKDCGELDFLFLIGNIIYIGECKHLLGRYDSNNWRADYSNFVREKGYNQTLGKKVRYLSARKDELKLHLSLQCEDVGILDLDIEVHGVFILNTPTMYMYASKFRIFTLYTFEDLAADKFTDVTYNVTRIDSDGNECLMEVKYPYFDLPVYLES